MNKIDQKHKEIVEFLTKNSDEKIVTKLSRYFKEGLDAYGIDRDLITSQRDKWLATWEKEMTIDDYLDLGDKLISTGKYEEAYSAIHFIMSKRDEFSRDTFNRLGKWLENGIQNWANTDVLCILVLLHFINDKVVQPEDFSDWMKSSSKWKRRAVPVTFYEVYKTGYTPEPLIKIIEKLMEDPEEDVQKGLGTMLREIWKKHPVLVEDFLMKWKNTCGRKIIQYATEKMDKEYRLKFKRDKK